MVDVVGNLRVGDLVRATRPDGTAVVVGFTTTGRFLLAAAQAAWHRRVSGRRVSFMNAGARRGDLVLLASMVEGGHVAPVVSRQYGFADLPEAVAHVAGGHAWGKVVVSVGDPGAMAPLVTSAGWGTSEGAPAALPGLRAVPLEA